jgi:hypothetical protein
LSDLTTLRFDSLTPRQCQQARQFGFPLMNTAEHLKPTTGRVESIAGLYRKFTRAFSLLRNMKTAMTLVLWRRAQSPTGNE